MDPKNEVAELEALLKQQGEMFGVPEEADRNTLTGVTTTGPSGRRWHQMSSLEYDGVARLYWVAPRPVEARDYALVDLVIPGEEPLD